MPLHENAIHTPVSQRSPRPRKLKDPARAPQDDCKVFSNSEVLGNSLATITSFPRRRESRDVAGNSSDLVR